MTDLAWQGEGSYIVPGGLDPSTATSYQVSGQQPEDPDAQRQLQENFLALPVGLVSYSFGLGDVAASLTAFQMYRTVALSSTDAVGRQFSVNMPFRGSVVAITIKGDANKSAGVATIQGYRNGTALEDLLVSWQDGTSEGEATFASESYPFAAGDGLDLRVTTDSTFAPAGSVDLEAMLIVAQTQSST